ncbi:MAG: ABC transporter permease [Clostridia bacterium]|nr:ABC transporter permease [Clostridia bacterium]
MTEFKDLFACEMYKVNRKKTLLKLGIAILVIIIAIAIFSAILKGIFVGSSIGGTEVGGSAGMIESLKGEIALFEENQTSLNKLLPDNTLYTLKSQLAMYEYLNENGIAPNGVTTYGAANMLEFNFYAFTEMSMSTAMSIIIIFIVVACCRATTGEYSSGALKMQFIRPINKNKFFTAKWLSVFIIAEAFMIASFIVSFLLGVAVFGANAPKVLFVIRASKVFTTSAIGALILGLLFKSVTVFMTVQVSMFICSLCKTNNKALVLGLIFIAFDIGLLAEQLLALAYVGYVGFLSNLDWMSALSLSGPAFKGMSLGTMIPITLIWGAMFMYISYKRFNKLEV